jgi:hypothetical protein
MIRHSFLYLARRAKAVVCAMTLATFVTGSATLVSAMSAVRGGPLPQPLPLFPADNWWNLDISNWPVDANSANYISFINNGGTRRLHPDLGGNAATANDPNGIYGIPFAVVTGVSASDLKPVQFQYWDESDGVDLKTGISFPFYPIPPEVIMQARWVEGGDPANVDRRSSQDRHLLIVDRDRNLLYELYNVFYDTARGKWFAGSGAFFDMNTNNRRPNTWTSADAAGLAVLPGLIRYDEVYDATITEIRHAFRATVRSTNGYVYPASHRAGSTAGALPLGARLRLKAGVDVTQRTSDPNVQKIFRAMQKYGLIVADNGSDMYITGTYDTRWDNGILNPAFANLTASDFEVVQLGYNAAPPVSVAALSSIGVTPASVIGGQSSSGTLNLSGAAPTGGARVSLVSANPAATVPSTVTVPGGSTSANFSVSTTTVGSITVGNITASYAGASKSAAITVNALTTAVVPAALTSLSVNPATVVGGAISVGTVKLNKAAPAGGIVVSLSSNRISRLVVPVNVLVPAGVSSANFNIASMAVTRRTAITITATYGGVIKRAALTIVRK